MQFARVIGSAVATAKTPGLSGRTLLVVQPISEEAEPAGAALVAVDRVGAGVEEIVLIATGSAARASLPADVEVDAAVVAIVDRIDIGRSSTYRKG